MALKYPKPAKGTATRTRRNTRRSKEAKFRDTVWCHFGVMLPSGRMAARCARCQAWAVRYVNGEVDHIKPRSTHPELAFDPTNGRVTCTTCNRYLKDHPLERDL